MSSVRWMGAAALLLVSGGCAPYDAMPALKRRASFDLRCPVESLQVTPLGGTTHGVDGCGQRATYVNQCPDPSRAGLAPDPDAACPWLLNSDAVQGGRPAPAQ